MKKCLLLAALIVLSACAPSSSTIQTAVAETMSAWTPVPSQVPTSTNTPIPANTKAATRLPSATMRPTTPSKTYILETGWCMLDVGDISGSDPKEQKYCNLDAREQVQMALNQQVEVKLNNLDGAVEVYCALFQMDGTFIMTDVDTTGSGKVTCYP